MTDEKYEMGIFETEEFQDIVQEIMEHYPVEEEPSDEEKKEIDEH